MTLTFLGTGAADWNGFDPALGFRRRFSSALVNGDLLLDPGPDVFDAARTFSVDLSGVRRVLVTHEHADHFCPETMDRLRRAGAERAEVLPGASARVGPYAVTALPANHATCPGARHYLISDGVKTLFYGLDGAWLTLDEVRGIRAAAPVDLAVLDGTLGDAADDLRVFEHNSLPMVTALAAALSPFVRRFAVSHMARTLHGTHAALEARLAGTGILAAFDGLRLEV